MRKEKRFSALFTCGMPLRPVPDRKTEVRETPAAYPSHKTRPGFDLSLIISYICYNKPHYPMKRVLNDLTPLPGNDLFITQYWFDKQTDPPLHFHEDYMLSLTLNVKGTRVTGQSVDNFTEKDLIIISRAYRTVTNATKPLRRPIARPSPYSSAAICPTGRYSKRNPCSPSGKC